MFFAQWKTIAVLLLTVGMLKRGVGGVFYEQRQGAGKHREAQDDAGGNQVVLAQAPEPQQAIAPPPPPLSPEEERERKAIETHLKLEKPVVLPKGLDKMPLSDAKSYFEERFELPILVNEQAFLLDKSAEEFRNLPRPFSK